MLLEKELAKFLQWLQGPAYGPTIKNVLRLNSDKYFTPLSSYQKIIQQNSKI